MSVKPGTTKALDFLIVVALLVAASTTGYVIWSRQAGVVDEIMRAVISYQPTVVTLRGGDEIVVSVVINNTIRERYGVRKLVVQLSDEDYQRRYVRVDGSDRIATISQVVPSVEVVIVTVKVRVLEEAPEKTVEVRVYPYIELASINGGGLCFDD